MPTNKQKICILIPVFEDFECLPLLAEKIQRHLSHITDYNILVIDDGSFKGLDKKLGIENRKCIQILTLSQNVGHQRSARISVNEERSVRRRSRFRAVWRARVRGAQFARCTSVGTPS